MSTRATKRFRAAEAGMAMVEIIVILGVVAILAGALAEPQIAKENSARIVRARAELAYLGASLERHYLEQRAFPAALTDSTFLSRAVGSGTDSGALRDEWGGTSYRYATLTTNPDSVVVYSVGPDSIDSGQAAEPLRLVVPARTVGDRSTRLLIARVAAAIASLQSGGSPGPGFASLPAAVDAGSVLDAYGTALRREGGGLTVRSAGADRVFSTADDLTKTVVTSGGGNDEDEEEAGGEGR